MQHTEYRVNKKNKKITKAQKVLHFPKGFLWGTATSAHQIEGDNRHSDWWRAEQKGEIKHKSGSACDSYNLYKKDHDLIEQMNNNAYRMSIEWARIEPEKGKFDIEAMHHYIKVLSDLKKRNIKVMLTLHHFTNPEWLTKMGGWANPRTPGYFIKYVKFVFQNVGGLVDFWITLNEPGVYVDLAYNQAKWPPKQKSVTKAFLAYINMARVHKKAYNFIHQQTKDAKVAFTMNVHSFASYHKHSLLNLLYVNLADRFVNHSFYDITKGKHDFLGVNYYFRVRIRQQEGSLLPKIENVTEQERELSDLGWMIYPHGIFDILMDMADLDLPIYITENGVAAKDDEKRQRFLVDHLKEIHHAIKAGVNVKGYFHWSLLDNFEWADGFDPKFGLAEVDLRTHERKLKDSGRIYGQIAKANEISEETCRLD